MSTGSKDNSPELRFQRFLFDISTALATVHADEFEAALDNVIEKTGKTFHVDRAYIFRFSDDQSTISNTHEWCADGVDSEMERMQGYQISRMPWLKKQIFQQPFVHIPDIHALPDEAEIKREGLIARSIQALLCVPFRDEDGDVTGFAGFDWVRRRYDSTDENILRLQITATIISGAIIRHRASVKFRVNRAVLLETQAIAEMGRWELNHVTNDLKWSEQTYRIFEHEPDDTGFKYEDFLGIVHADDREDINRAFAASIEEKKPYSIEHRLLMKDGRIKWVYEKCQTAFDADGKPLLSTGIVQDITARKQGELREKLKADILSVLNDKFLVAQSLERIVESVFERTELDAVGFRMKKGDDYPYLACRGFSEEFIQKESSLLEKSQIDGLCGKIDEKQQLACLCGRVISGDFDPKHPHVTDFGSFWCNDTAALSANPELITSPFPRGRCIESGYRSIALIPVKANDVIVGLLQLNNMRPNSFSRESVRFFEEMSLHIGAAISQELLRKDLNDQLVFLITCINAITTPFMVINTQDYSVEMANLAALKFGDYTKGNVKCHELSHGQSSPCSSEEHPCPIDIIIHTGKPLVVEHIHLDSQGQKKYVEIHASPIFNEKGQVVKLIEYALDITARKEVELTLLDTNRQLEAAALETNELLVKAQMASIAKGEFLANMSHEIRTPMNAIIGMSGLLLDTGLDNRQRQYTQAIHDSSYALLNVINDILDFSKIESNKLNLESTNFDLQALLDSIVSTMSWQARSKGLEFRFVLDEDVPVKLNGDPQRLRQILNNLLGNAIKFTDEGSVSLHVCSHGASDGDYVFLKFSVTDTGIGIHRKELPLLFDNFYQSDSSTTRKQGGTGLGLSISKRLVEMMGGSMEVQSAPGEGSTFSFAVRFMLPNPEELDSSSQSQADAVRSPAEFGSDHEVASAHARATNDSTLRNYYEKQQVKVLLAEDNRTNQLVATAMLEQIGITSVDVAENGLEAIKCLEGNDYDLVLMDIQMPEMDGFEAARQIRSPESQVKNHDIPIVALTAHALSGYREQCVAAGMNDYLSKPFILEDLCRIVEKCLLDSRGGRNTTQGSAAPSETAAEVAEAPAASPTQGSAAPSETAAEITQAHPVLDVPDLNKRLMGDKDLIRDIVGEYMKTSPELISQLLDSVDNNDCKIASAVAHRIKGSTATIGAKSLAALAGKMEKAARDSDLSALKELSKDLNSEYERLHARLLTLT